MGWFLLDNGLRYERVKAKFCSHLLNFLPFDKKSVNCESLSFHNLDILEEKKKNQSQQVSNLRFLYLPNLSELINFFLPKIIRKR